MKVKVIKYAITTKRLNGTKLSVLHVSTVVLGEVFRVTNSCCITALAECLWAILYPLRLTTELLQPCVTLAMMINTTLKSAVIAIPLYNEQRPTKTCECYSGRLECKIRSDNTDWEHVVLLPQWYWSQEWTSAAVCTIKDTCMCVIQGIKTTLTRSDKMAEDIHKKDQLVHALIFVIFYFLLYAVDQVDCPSAFERTII